MLALATNTWHAYNDFGGPNLYTGGTHVSMQRPMAAGYLFKPPGKGRRVTGTGAPDPQNAAHVGYLQLNHLSGYAGSAGWPDWELPFIEWAEREGFEVGVCTNDDLEHHPEVLDDAHLYLSVGHDEYWSRGMRDTVEAFIARGGNAAFFSGNTSLWQVRIEGEDHDVMVGYKGFFKNDPVMETDREVEATTFWSDVVVGRPENHMTGVTFTRGGYHRIGRNVTAGLGGYTVHRAGHWIFEGTGLGYGDVLGAGATVVGYECDGCVFTYRDGLPYPTGEDGTPSTFEILGTCPTQHFTARALPARRLRERPASWSTSRRACSARATPKRWSASVTATPCWAHTRTSPVRRCSRRGRPTGPTAWPGATRRSSRSRGTSSPASGDPPVDGDVDGEPPDRGLDDRADGEREGDGPHPDVAAEQPTGQQHADLEGGPHQPQAVPHAARPVISPSRGPAPRPVPR